MMIDLPLQVWGNRVLLQAVSPETVTDRVGSLVIPRHIAEEAQQHSRWLVVDVGEDVRDPALAIGAQVIVSAWATQEIVWQEQRFRVAYAEQIVGVLTGT